MESNSTSEEQETPPVKRKKILKNNKKASTITKKKAVCKNTQGNKSIKKEKSTPKQTSTDKLHSNKSTKKSNTVQDDNDSNDGQDESESPSIDSPDYADKLEEIEIKKDQFTIFLPHINLHYKIIEEVCLEGLDGITLEALWTRLSIALEMPLPIPEVLQKVAWNILTQLRYLEFYLLQKARSKLIVYDIDATVSNGPIASSLDIYPCCPIKESLGSAADYTTRQNISDVVRNLTLSEADLQYGSQLVIVADEKLRVKCIKNSLSDPLCELTPFHYCILERIGRSRYVGEVTSVNSFLQQLCKDSGFLFYNRKFLENMNLIVKQHFVIQNQNTCSTSLVHLPRFYREWKSKYQMMTERIVEFLRTKPDYRCEYSEIKAIFGNIPKLRKLMKLQECLKYIKVENMSYREFYPDSATVEWKWKSKDHEKVIRIVTLKDPFINVSGSWNDDESKDESSDEEENGSIIYNDTIQHQIYKHMQRNGEIGQSIRELTIATGLDFYTVRACVKQLRMRNLVVALKVDCGRQRTMKYHVSYFDDAKIDSAMQEDPHKIETLEKESIDFLSNLLDVKPELLDPSKSNKDKSSNQLDTQGSTELSTNDVLKDQQKYRRITGNLHFDMRSKKVFDSELCQQLCTTNQIIERRKHWDYGNLLYKLQQFIEHQQQFSVESCPLQIPQMKISYKKLCKDVLKITQLILSRYYNHKIKVLMPKASDVHKPDQDRTISSREPDTVLTESKSEEEQSTNQEVVESSNPLKRKTEFPETSNKKIKSDYKPKQLYTCTNIFMGPKPKVIIDTVDADNVEIKIFSSTEPEDFSEAYAKYSNDQNLTVQKLERANFIIEIIRQEKIVTDLHRIQKLLVADGREKGSNTTIDRRSVDRIYTRLVKGGQMKILQVILKSALIVRSVYVGIDSSLDLNESVLKSIIDQLKAKFFMQKVTVKEPPTVANPLQIDSSVNELGSHVKNVLPYKHHRTIGKIYGNLPKFPRLYALHEYLYYMIYDYPSKTDVIDIRKLLENHNLTVDEDVNDMPRAYNTEIGWKMFIPPLREHVSWPRGWALVCDLILRLPLSLFVKLINVSYVIPGLFEYLNHPVKQHYLLRYLPVEIRNGLIHRRKFLSVIHESLMRLCFMGLLQFGPQKLREKDQLFVYLNRKATLLDTTTNKAGYHYIENKPYKELHYNFNNFADLETYWKEMWNICAHSNLGIRNSVAGTYITIEQAETKPILKIALQAQTPESVVIRDNGHIPGDKRGAAGLDSAMWGHLKRNWSWIPHIGKSLQDDSFDDVDDLFRTQFQLKFPSNIKTLSGKQQFLQKKLKEDNKVKNVPMKQKTETVIKLKRGKKIIRKVIHRSDKKSESYDDVDRKLLARLKYNRVKWNENENRIMQISKMISKFLMPHVIQKINVPYILIRDVLHTLSPKSRSKTSFACKRHMYSVYNSNEQEELFDHIIDVLPYVPFIKKYLGKLLNNKKLSVQELKSVFVYLVIHFYENQHEIEHFFKVISDRDPSLLDAFKMNYMKQSVATSNDTHQNANTPAIFSYECPDSVPKLKANNFYNEIKDHPRTKDDVIVDTIRSIIHSAVGCKQEDISWIHQLFRVYQNYPNDLLTVALEHVRSTQMISLRRSQLKKNQQAESLPIAMKTLQFSFYYSFMQINKFPLKLYLEAHEMLLGIIKHKSEVTNVSSNGLPMESFEQGHTVGLAEIAFYVKSYFNVDVPKEALILNPSITDHTELIQELAIRYKKMLISVKQGTYFKDDDENSENTQSGSGSADVTDSVQECSTQDRYKTPNRAPMIQRFLKSWFLTEEPDVQDDTEQTSDYSTTEISNLDQKKAKDDIEKKNEKKRKRLPQMTNKDSKKILESLYSETTEARAEKDVNPIGGMITSDLSFEDYEKKLENLLCTRDITTEATETEENVTVDDTEESNILEKFLSSRKATIMPEKPQKSENVVDIRPSKPSVAIENPIQILNKIPDAADSIMNARMQYLLNDDLTVEQIMDEMLKDCPLEERKVPLPTNLARLLVKGIFPEFDEDEERLERLQKHFLVVCPNTSLLLSNYENNEALKYLEVKHYDVYKNLLNNIQKNIILKESVPSNDQVFDHLKKIGGTEMDIKNVKELIEFVHSKQAIGASVKELKEHSFNFEHFNLATILQHLTDMNVFLRAGISYIVFVHHEHRKHWLIESCTLCERDKQKLTEPSSEESLNEHPISKLSSLESYAEIKLQIKPWISVDGTLNLKIFEKWMCTILGYCLSGGQTLITDIFQSCCYLKPVDVYYILECLQELRCIRMVTYRNHSVTLFSSTSITEEVAADITDSFEDLYIETDNLAVIKLGALLNKELVAFDFPSDEAKKYGTF